MTFLARAIGGCAASLVLAFAGPASAQPYPARPVHVIVPFATGSSIELFARTVLEDIQKRTGATFVVESKPGALGAIGTDAVARATPDGYPIMTSSSATHSSGPQLAKTPYDARRDFTPLASLVRFDLMLVANATNGAKTVEQLVAEGRRKKLLFGYGSATGQVGASAFSRAAGLETDGVSYKGQPLALNDLAGGQIDFVMADIPAVATQVRAGRLTALAVSSDRRSALFPEVRTMAEAGLKVELIGWVGLAGPAKLPPEVRAWWTRQVELSLANPAVLERYKGMGIEPLSVSGEAFERFVLQQYDVWGRHIREAGLATQ